VQELTHTQAFASSRITVKVASLDTGQVLYEEDAGKWMQPASNLKLYTVAAALDRFGPDYRFVTSVYAPTRLDASGTVRGDLVVYGRGDPTFATRFNNLTAPAGTSGTPVTPAQGSEYYKAIDDLAARVVAAGVRRVEGDLVGDESYLTGEPLPPGWEWDDLQWYYGAEVSALTVNDNSVDLSVRPGERAGDPCRVTIGPETPLVTVVNTAKTAPRATPRRLTVHRALGENVIEISGEMPADDRPYTASIAVTHPALLFASMFRASLERQGVVVTGRTRTVDARAREAAPLEVSSLYEVAARQSPPLSVIAAQTLKPSQNLYTELLLRTLGKATATAPKEASDEAGLKAVRDFAARAGLDPDQVVMLDGSGLSRANLVTADTTVKLLVYMNRHRYSQTFRDALPVAGVDGTLRNRMKGSVATGNVRAKTGTLGTATTLSGYVLSAAGERLVFSVMVNNPPRDADPRIITDGIAVMLAGFNGHT
jgi:D-alanyl-D-alanine carboxypeptidase/D-alanyl-D-alanine-endopeptidase (penicillin-binding protein 4)